MRSGPGRRSVLAAGAGAAALAAVTMSGTACAVAAAATGRVGGGVPGKGTPGRETASPGEAAPRGTVDRLRVLERAHGTTLGVFGRNLATGRTVRYRAGELFPLSGLFAPLAAAALLRDGDRATISESARTTGGAEARATDRATGHQDNRAADRPADAARPADARALAELVRYSRADLLPGSPVTGAAEHLGRGLSLAALCEAAVRHGDRTAGNLLLRRLGGPGALTRFARSVGDRVTRLDRWEPELNSAEPDRRTDTTTPYAIARTYAHLTVGDALGTADSCLLTGWMRQHTAGPARFRAGLPAGWLLADTTGGGPYGTGHDVGIVWTPEGTPLLLACLTRGAEPGEEPDDALLAETAALLAEVLV
ncbi:class A beta-lactamase [Streptomyces physcomitrii]|uniref:class A beta-lactamase n=1 Tax=Streptomyces physcomitrii TaxID=2724184 RepID=UPI0028A7CFB9|nr:class A beta-lactamase [Streptomyces physcomitrii]